MCAKGTHETEGRKPAMRSPIYIYRRIVTCVLESVNMDKLYELSTSACKDSPKNK